MSSLRIENIPDDVLSVLQRRAAMAGQSLEEHVLGVLTKVARQPTIDDILSEVEQRSGGSVSLAFAVAAQRADRDAR